VSTRAASNSNTLGAEVESCLGIVAFYGALPMGDIDLDTIDLGRLNLLDHPIKEPACQQPHQTKWCGNQNTVPCNAALFDSALFDSALFDSALFDTALLITLYLTVLYLTVLYLTVLCEKAINRAMWGRAALNT
jgi:hypothetical protein